MIQIKCLIVLLALVECTIQTDYCARSLCGGRHHIACHNSGRFARICQNANLVAMTPRLRHIILSKHNQFRNLIASGRVPGFSPAAKIPILKWNNELAHFAQLNVLQCRMQHDQCRNTFHYKYCGQNLAMRSSTGENNVESTVIGLITSWYREHSKASMNDINTFRGYNLHAIGHFTAMIQEKASEVGCAIATYRSNGWNHLLIACDYSFGNVIGVPVYTSGRSCSLCRTGCNRQYTALCSEHEQINPNP